MEQKDIDAAVIDVQVRICALESAKLFKMTRPSDPEFTKFAETIHQQILNIYGADVCRNIRGITNQN